MHDKDFDWGLSGLDLDDEDDDDYDDFDVHEKGFDWVLSTSGLGQVPHYGQRNQLAFFSLSLFSFDEEEEVIEFLKRYEKGQRVTMTHGYDGHRAGLILRIQLIVFVE